VGAAAGGGQREGERAGQFGEMSLALDTLMDSGLGLHSVFMHVYTYVCICINIYIYACIYIRWR